MAKKGKAGEVLRGQAWVELHGIFYAKQLRSIADQIEKNCKGLEKKNVNSVRLDNQLVGVPSDH